MRMIPVSYTVLKGQVTAKSLGVYYAVGPSNYQVFAASSSYVLMADAIVDTGDYADFEATLKAGATLVESLNDVDALVSLPQPMTAMGIPSITIQDIRDDCAAYRRSWLIECPAQTITLRDLRVADDLLGPTGVCMVAASSFGCATSATLGSELQIDLIDRDDVLGYFPYIGAVRSRLTGLTGVLGAFEVGEEVRGATCRAKVLGVGADYLEITFDRWNAIGKPANFVDGEVITGQTSGATATLGTPAFTEGGFLFLQRFMRDEALYGFKSHEQRPGGARIVPAGLYFRCAVFNNHATDTLYVDGSIDIGKQ